MATEQEKSDRRARLWGLTSIGLTLGIWDMVQESALTLSLPIGQAILVDMEKAAGLELVGEKPEDVLVEIGRICIDEGGFASDARVEKTDKGLQVTLLNAVGTPEFAALKEKGVEKLFSHPFYCVGLAALARLGCKARGSVEIDQAHNNQIISFELC
jgi:hypothetical protein